MAAGKRSIESPAIVAATGVDPVCGMAVAANVPTRSVEYRAARYVFCSDRCRTKFLADPSRYVSRPDVGTAGVDTAGTLLFASGQAADWTCPMHPQVRSAQPGSCPLCGMALEPAEPAEGDEANPELTDFTRRLLIGAILAVPLLLLTMGQDMAGFDIVPRSWSSWIQLGLSAPIVLWGGAPIFHRAWASLRAHRLNMYTLVAMGVGAAFGFSVAATLAPFLAPIAWRERDTMPVYYEAAGVVVVLVLLGQVLELRARAGTGRAIRALIALSPKTAWRLKPDGSDEPILLSAIARGDKLRIRPGASVPVDGVVIEGRSNVDESMLTGEAALVFKTIGSSVTGGTVNGTGGLVMEARAVGADTMLAQIVAMVAQAQRTRAPIQAAADWVAAWFVPLVVLISIATFAIWALAGPQPRLGHALLNAIAVLIIACPCALGLATPMSITVGVGRGAQAGVLVRTAEALQALDKVDTLAIDKTGTLTEGKPQLITIKPAAGFTDRELLAAAAAVEALSEHPLAGAIVAGAHERGLTLAAVEDFDSQTGLGIRGRVAGRTVAIGNGAQMRTAGADLELLEDLAASDQPKAAGVVFVAIDGVGAGVLTVADPIRTSAKDALAKLRAEGLRIVMVTGDGAETAKAVATSVGGIEAVHADLRPEDKAAIVRELTAQGRHVAMAGDGVNDAPALAVADVGLAMGTGTDVAIKTASITLTRSDLDAIVRARRLARATMRNIRQNLVFSFLFNGIGIPLAAGVLYPSFGIQLSPMLAGGAMALSSFAVVVNALRLNRVPLD